MLAVKTFNYNGQNINQRSDGYLNASQMCIANGKLFSDWNRGKSTKAYVVCLSEAMGISIADLIVVQNGNQTWIHPSLAINLARWISPAFAVWCDSHIFNLMSTGSTTLDIDPIENMKLKIQLASLENSKTQAELQILQLRQYVTTSLPEPVQQKILGYQTIETVEYRDRIIAEDRLLNDGNSVTKTELCRRYGYLTKSGAPDYQRLNKRLKDLSLPSEAWELRARIQDTQEFRREYLPELDRMMTNGDQMWIGE
ncbi:MAG: KilA-N domain-containing protein [Chitinophagia bacterium]|nr:KilA-N domain-containing protein [Chitinophagia bacterium]